MKMIECYPFSNVFHELCGSTWGIIGLGNIGRRVADIAKAFGCHVIYYSTSGKHEEEGYERVDLDILLKTSDIVSVHAPLNENTLDLMDKEAFAKMKNSAIFNQCWHAVPELWVEAGILPMRWKRARLPQPVWMC